MASIYDIKPKFQALLRPLLRQLAGYGVTPNQITLSAIVLSGLGGLLIGYSQMHPALLLVVPLVLLCRMALNALDGMLAREYSKSSPLGEILNEVGDILSDVALYLPLIFLFSNLQTILLIAIFNVLACLTEFCGVLAKAMIGERRYDGPMGKSDRAFIMSILTLSLFLWPTVINQLGTPIFLLLSGLLMASCINRLRFILTVKKEVIS